MKEPSGVTFSYGETMQDYEEVRAIANMALRIKKRAPWIYMDDCVAAARKCFHAPEDPLAYRQTMKRLCGDCKLIYLACTCMPF